MAKIITWELGKDCIVICVSCTNTPILSIQILDVLIDFSTILFGAKQNS